MTLLLLCRNAHLPSRRLPGAMPNNSQCPVMGHGHSEETRSGDAANKWSECLSTGGRRNVPHHQTVNPIDGNILRLKVCRREQGAGDYNFPTWLALRQS